MSVILEEEFAWIVSVFCIIYTGPSFFSAAPKQDAFVYRLNNKLLSNSST